MMDLLHDFSAYVAKEKLFSSGDRLLVAVSGGLDSVVLCELMHRAGWRFRIAHCNFQLRGEESERDERFVRGLAGRYDCEVLVKRFDTMAYASGHKISIQVAARELRYDWFREVGGVLLTAHHLDDNIETLLMNFFKGTGISGLRAMQPKQGKVVRPLLFTGRAELYKFASGAGLEWVEDSSNESDKYTRNYFRHRVIPLIEEVYPGTVSNLANNIGRFREIEQVYRRAIDQQLKKLVEPRGNEAFVPVLKLKGLTPLPTLVYEMITPYGFSAQQTDAVIALLDSGSGKYICSATHRILKNRNWLIISPLQTMEASTILIEAGDTRVEYDGGILTLSLRDELPQDPGGSHVAWLDASMVSFPLLLRRWKQGDYFYPLGMRKKKKLARFLIDNKLSLADKERIWVLESDKKILWVVGKRIDDRFKIGAGAGRVLRIEWTAA